MNVDRTNFEQVFPTFIEQLREATFVAIDAEYSGLGPTPQSQPKSMFDSAHDRYEKAKAGSRYIICQFGIALIRKEGQSSCYRTECYNFYLFPAYIQDYAFFDSFLWETSSILFLRKHNFDFERCIQQGIPFLNDRQVEELRSYLSSKTVGTTMPNFQAPDDDTDVPKVAVEAPLCDEEIEKIISKYRGFSRVIEVLSKLKMPIVGHNMYTDLTLMYNQFCQDLPETYEEYKANLHRRFPHIYDTKTLAYEIRKMLNKLNPKLDNSYLGNTSLFALYKNTSDPPGLSHPVISLGPRSRSYGDGLEKGKEADLEELPDAPVHEAGFDACVTGALFTQLAYIVWQKELANNRLPQTLTFDDIFQRFTPWENIVNVGRARIPSMNVSGKDMPSNRPNWILIESSTRTFNKIDLKVIQRIATKLGDCEIKYDKETNIACIACSQHRNKDITWKELKREGYNLTEIPDKDEEDALFPIRACFTVGALVVAVVGLSCMTSMVRWLFSYVSPSSSNT